MILKKHLFIALFLAFLCPFSLWGSPAFKVTLSSLSLKQGDTLKIDVITADAIEKSSVLFHNRTFSLFNVTQKADESQTHLLYLGVPRTMTPGTYKVKVYVHTKGGA